MTDQQYSQGFSCRCLRMTQLWVTVSAVCLWNTDGFVPSSVNVQRFSSPFGLQRQSCSAQRKQRRLSPSFLYGDSFEDDDEDDDDDDDDYIDTEMLGDWRNFRRSLAMGTATDDSDSSSGAKDSTAVSMASSEREITDNERVLEEQNQELAEEYASGIWAHQIATPEVGGLVVRMPLEVELYRNYRHSITGSKLRTILVDDGEGEDIPTDDLVMDHWYGRSRDLIEEQMKKIADMADEEGQIDATTLAEDYSEMLQLYLDNQETWQEVCLVLEQTESSEGSKCAKTLVLNRPMAFKLTKDLGRLVYFGAFDESNSKISRDKVKGLTRFMLAFREECAVYVGGPDDQGKAATVIHGIPNLPGATEISPGANIYRGGLEAAVDGILAGRYSPLEFRFFVGCHDYEESMLDVEVLLGKYQPIACARALALKQCISLPKPLWHEVMELCDGDLPDLSRLEMAKREDVTFHVLDESADLSILLDGDEDFDIEILDDEEDDDAPSAW